MITIARVVEEIFAHDDLAQAAAAQGWLNISSYARSIQPRVQAALLKEVQEGSIITTLARLVAAVPRSEVPGQDVVQSLAVQSNLEAMTYERTTATAAQVRDLYRRAVTAGYLTITQGINEITVIAEADTAQAFRAALPGTHLIYHKNNLVGITAKFRIGYIEVPNLIFMLTRRLAYKNINIIEVVSTATELTYVIEKKDLPAALEQLQKDM